MESFSLQKIVNNFSALVAKWGLLLGLLLFKVNRLWYAMESVIGDEWEYRSTCHWIER